MSSFLPSDWVELSRAAVREFKSARNDMPPGKQRDEITEKIKRAEDLLARADAELAQKFGYYLCKCDFPGTPMLWLETQAAYVCKKCGHRKEKPQAVQYNKHRSWAQARRARGVDFDPFTGE
jgi:hypothetical protein